MANYIEKKYSAYSKVDAVFLRCMVCAELLCSESAVMKLQHQLFGKGITKMTYFQFLILIEAGLAIEDEPEIAAPAPKLIKLSSVLFLRQNSF